jgi:hypothetical protein
MTDFRLSKWFTVDIHPLLEALHHAEVGSTADLSEVNAASLFRVEASEVSKRSCYIGWWSNEPTG